MKDYLRAIVYGGLFIVPFLTLYVANDYFFPFITGKNFAFRIIVEIVTVAWILLMLVDAKYRPKYSGLLASFGVLIVVMFFANLLGQDPHTGFWSNFERMDGYITLVHVFLYTFILGSVLTTEKLWNAYLHTTLSVAFVVSFYGLLQYSGSIAGYNGRIESYLGNAAYFAIYMYFHIFIVWLLFVRNRSLMLRAIYGLLTLLFVFTLLQSGTRGTFFGLIAGSLVMVTYVAIFGVKYPQFRRFAVSTLAVLLLAGAGFYLAKDSSFVQNNGALARIANINLTTDLKVRGTIWAMAWEGVKERPILGWGQGNFNYVFNEKYNPFLFDQEQWFDRAHDIFFDWLIAGGFLGLIAYFSILGSCVYYLVVAPLRNKDNQTFTVLERGILLGALVGYLVHNLVVFDNIVSYIFFGVILALIHSRVGKPLWEKYFAKIKIDSALFNQFFVPVGTVVAVALVYFINVPGMQAAGDIISAYRTEDPAGKLAMFETALNRNSFAHQEITEQISQQAMKILGDKDATDAVKQDYIKRSEEELTKLVAEKPGDARIHVFFSSFYRSINDLENADKEIVIAQELSPRKPSIIMQRAIIKYSQGKMEEARDLFKQAYELDLRNTEARNFYAGTLFLTGEGAKAKDLADSEERLKQFASSDFILSAVNKVGDMDYLKELYEVRVTLDPKSAQNWASLSFIYYQAGDKASAIETLNKASEAVPTFAKSAQCFIANIKLDKDPQEGCSSKQ